MAFQATCIPAASRHVWSRSTYLPIGAPVPAHLFVPGKVLGSTWMSTHPSVAASPSTDASPAAPLAPLWPPALVPPSAPVPPPPPIPPSPLPAPSSLPHAAVMAASATSAAIHRTTPPRCPTITKRLWARRLHNKAAFPAPSPLLDGGQPHAACGPMCADPLRSRRAPSRVAHGAGVALTAPSLRWLPGGEKSVPCLNGCGRRGSEQDRARHRAANAPVACFAVLTFQRRRRLVALKIRSTPSCTSGGAASKSLAASTALGDRSLTAPSSSPGATLPSPFATATRVLTCGSGIFPRSKLLMWCGTSPDRSASASMVSPRASRRRRISLPICTLARLRGGLATVDDCGCMYHTRGCMLQKDGLGHHRHRPDPHARPDARRDDPARQVAARPAARRRRDGGRVRRHAPERHPRGGEGPPPRAHHSRPRPLAVPEGGLRREQGRPPRRRPGARRRRRRRRCAVPGHGAARRRVARGAPRATRRQARGGRGARRSGPAARRARRRARQGHRPPRHQAGERVPHPRRRDQGARLRDCAAARALDGEQRDPRRLDDGHAGLHGARARARALGRGRRTERPLVRRRPHVLSHLGADSARGAHHERGAARGDVEAGAVTEQRGRAGARRRRGGPRARVRQGAAVA